MCPSSARSAHCSELVLRCVPCLRSRTIFGSFLPQQAGSVEAAAAAAEAAAVVYLSTTLCVYVGEGGGRLCSAPVVICTQQSRLICRHTG